MRCTFLLLSFTAWASMRFVLMLGHAPCGIEIRYVLSRIIPQGEFINPTTLVGIELQASQKRDSAIWCQPSGKCFITLSKRG
jgi:hypothetical protein